MATVLEGFFSNASAEKVVRFLPITMVICAHPVALCFRTSRESIKASSFQEVSAKVNFVLQYLEHLPGEFRITFSFFSHGEPGTKCRVC
jgi:hypothetical protein